MKRLSRLVCISVMALPFSAMAQDVGLEWETEIGGIYDATFGVDFDSAGNIVTATRAMTPEGPDLSSISKFDSSGFLLWTTDLPNAPSAWPFVTVDSTDHIFVSGRITGTGLPSGENSDIFLAKIDPSGGLLWLDTHDLFANASDEEWVYGIDSDDSGIYVSGGFRDSTYNGFVAKFDDAGNLLWMTTLDTGANDDAFGISVYEGNSYVGGYTNGAFPGQTNSGSYDAYVAHLTGSGAIAWITQFGSGAYDGAYSVDVNAMGVFSGG